MLLHPKEITPSRGIHVLAEAFTGDRIYQMQGEPTA